MFFSPLTFQFLFYSIYFIVAIVIAFIIPGFIFIRKLKLSFFQTLVLSTILGLALWIWQGFLFGFLGIRFLTYLYLAVFFVSFLKIIIPVRKRFDTKSLRIGKGTVLILVILIIGIIVQCLSVWFMGISTQSGVYFCCGNMKDSLFHLSLSHQLIKNVPPLEPGMSGVIVHNYHYLSNLVNAELSRVFNIPLVLIQFQFINVFLSLLLGLCAISFAKNNKLSISYICWLLFFLFFGGDLVYLILLILGKGLSFRMGSLEDGSIFLVNPPRAMAIVMFFGALSLFSQWIRRKNLYLGFLLAIIVSTLIGLKVYIGIFAISGFIGLGFYFLIKRQLKMLLPLIFSLMGCLVFYLPVNKAAGGLFFTSFWRFENYISQPEFGLIRVELARIIYQDHHNYIKVYFYEICYMLFYITAIFGTKITGLFQTKKSFSLLPLPVHIVLITGIVVSLIFGFFFQQTSGGSNSFNFIVSVFIISSLYAALSMSFWQKKLQKYVAIIVCLIIIGITVPRVIFQTIQNFSFISSGRGYILTNPQLELTTFAKNKSPKEALYYIDASFIDEDYESPFVSFLIDRPVYLSGRGILADHNVNTDQRFITLGKIKRSSDTLLVASLLRKTNIQYIITHDVQHFSAPQAGYFMKEVFRNSSGKILKIVPDKLSGYIKNYKKIIKSDNKFLI